MDAAFKEILQYGALGGMLVILVAFIIWYIKRRDTIETEIRQVHKAISDEHSNSLKEILTRHENERAQWMGKMDGMYMNLIKVIERNSNVIAEHTETIKSRLPR